MKGTETTMRCSACNQPIKQGEQTAIGSDGELHYRCFKRGTAQGEEVSVVTLSEQLGQLKKRVQDLERQMEETAPQAYEAHLRTMRIGSK